MRNWSFRELPARCGRDLGGHHRVSPCWLSQAEYDPQPPFGGIDWSQVDRRLMVPTLTQMVRDTLPDHPDLVAPPTSCPQLGGPWICPQASRRQPAPHRSTPSSERLSRAFD
jgi:hypothetical protein